MQNDGQTMSIPNNIKIDVRVLKAIQKMSRPRNVPYVAYASFTSNSECLQSLERLYRSKWVTRQPGCPMEVFAEYPNLYESFPVDTQRLYSHP